MYTSDTYDSWLSVSYILCHLRSIHTTKPIHSAVTVGQRALNVRDNAVKYNSEYTWVDVQWEA